MFKMCQIKCIVTIIFLILFTTATSSEDPTTDNDGEDGISQVTDEEIILTTKKPNPFPPLTTSNPKRHGRTRFATTRTPSVDSEHPQPVESDDTTSGFGTYGQSSRKDDVIDRSYIHTVPINDTQRPENVSFGTREHVQDIRDTRIDQGPPTMIDIPGTREDLLQMQGDPKLKDHPGLKAAQDAIRNTRSPKNAYILCVGLAGAGKSSTINFLFGKDLASIGETVSGKSEIVEYFANVPIPDLGVNNSQLRIIDTPGLGGGENDARVLASLNKYLTNHEDLKNALPNIVLIFSKFDDNRFQGPSSTFVKMLKRHNMVRDTFIPPTDEPTNIIYVMTRLLSETKKVQRNPSERINKFREVIQNYTTFPGPIVISLAENLAEEEELPKSGDNYKLPNKELYPKNLIDRILNISTGQKIASAIFNSSFENRKTLDVQKLVIFKLLDGKEDSVDDMRRLIEDGDFPIHPSEVTDALKEADDKIDPDLRKAYRASLQLLQRSFQTRNIKNITQIPTKRSDIVTFLQGSNMNPAMIALFQKAFSIEIPEYEFALVTGHGYDVLRDESLEHSPFVFEDLKFSKLGFKIPDGMTAEPVAEEVNILNFYTNTGEYMGARVRELGLQEDIKEDNYEAEFHPGYNVIDAKSKVTEIQVTSIREIRKFQLVLNEKVPFNQDFQDDIAELPSFNIHDRDSVSEWTSLFKKYGTHVVESAYGGGEMETIVEAAQEDLRNLRNGQTDDIKDAVSKLPQNSEYLIEFQNSLPDSKISIHLKGGDHKFGRVNLAEMDLATIIENVEEWKQTLGYQSIMLKSKLQIKPLSDIVKQVNTTIAVEMQKAVKAWLEGTLEYVAPPTPPPTQQSQTEIDERQQEILTSLNRTLSELTARAAAQKEENERAHRLFLELMKTTTTPKPIYNWPTRAEPTTMKPTDQRGMMTRAGDYVLKSIYAVPAELYKIREKLIGIYDNIVNGRLNSTELEPDNVKKLVDAAKQETERPTSPPETAITAKSAGYGYDMIREQFTRKTPFYLTENAFTKRKVNGAARTSYVHEVFNDVQAYINFRARSTNSNIYFRAAAYRGTLIPGNTRLYEDTTDTVVKEYKEWFINLNKPFTQSFNRGFKSDIDSLIPFEVNDCISVAQWRTHFNEYGTHIINSAYVGGAIEFLSYGNTFRDIRKCRITEIPSYFENGYLEDKQFVTRAIGGDPGIISRDSVIGRRRITDWADTIKTNMVVLPTDIKLIPIYKFISQVRPSIYNDYLKAFNAYLEGGLDVCGNGIACDLPGQVKCVCPRGQKLMNRYCKTLVGFECSVDTWDDCAPNSVCDKVNDDYGICRCREGFERTSKGLCFKPNGQYCFDTTQCHVSAGLGCFAGKCQCGLTLQRYDSAKAVCFSGRGNACGIEHIYGIRYKFKCQEHLVCDPEEKICIST